MSRKRTPQEIEAAVLTKSARRCTLCFYLSGDLREKRGQIAHIAKDPSNWNEDNLAFICLDHHTQFDSKTSQHKNYTILEVKAARSRLYEAIAQEKHYSAEAGSPTVNARRESVPEVTRADPLSPLMPLVREVTIPAKAVPINLRPGLLMPPMASFCSAELASFYGLLQGLTQQAFQPLPQFVGLPESDRPADERAGARFVAELFQYVLFRSIDLLQHSTVEYVKGVHRTATVPPEAVIYAPDEIAAVVQANRFSRIGQEPVLWTTGSQIRVPKGSRIRFSQHDGDSLIAPTYVVEFRNPSLYVLRVSAYVSCTYESPTEVAGTTKGAGVVSTTKLRLNATSSSNGDPTLIRSSNKSTRSGHLICSAA